MQWLFKYYFTALEVNEFRGHPRYSNLCDMQTLLHLSLLSCLLCKFWSFLNFRCVRTCLSMPQCVDYLLWCVVIVKIHFKIWPCCVVSICSTSNECEYNLSTLDQILVTTDWSWFDKQIMCLYMFSQPQMHGMRAGKDGSVIQHRNQWG